NTAVGNGFNPIINTSNCNYSDLTDNGGSQPPSCPNQWLANTYGTSDSPCATVDGHKVTPPTAVSNRAPTAPHRPASPNGALRRPVIPTGPPRGRGGWTQQ
ncbi:MAG: hypothetical protein M3083_18000, partial [Actinomycetota bacterium]|nr:hypothetical protein [Actinomycetota bacterium]